MFIDLASENIAVAADLPSPELHNMQVKETRVGKVD
jgi:hypothetical protein